MHPVKHVAGTALDDERTRRWVTNLRRPERLDDPVMRDLLRAHGRAADGGPLDVGRRGAELLHEKIEALRPPDGVRGAAALPHRVLTTCFVEGAKSFQAAARLGLSERQLSRERGRAISLLTAELASLARERAAPFAPPPGPLVPRTATARRLAELVERSGRVHVRGAAGAGKTCLVRAFAATGSRPVHWLTVVPRVSSELRTLLFDLGEQLGPEDPSLATYMRESLPVPHAGLATRIALVGLGRVERLLVVDDFDALGCDRAAATFLEEAARRLPSLRIVTIGRGRLEPACGPELVVPPLTEAEVRALLELRSIPEARAAAGPLSAWTGGNARLLDLAARALGGRPSDEAASATACLRAAAQHDHLLSCARTLARAA